MYPYAREATMALPDVVDTTFADPLLKAIRDARPRGIPHRILPSLRQLGYYKGIRDLPKATGVTFDVLRRMSGTPVVRMVVDKRKTQAAMYAREPRHRHDVGCEFVLRDTERNPSPIERKEIAELKELILHGGYRWKRVTDGQVARWDGRGEEKALRFDQLVRVLVEDMLVLDAACIRKEMPRKARDHPVYEADPEAREHATDHPPIWFAPIDGARMRRAEQTYRLPKGQDALAAPTGAFAGEYEPEIRKDLRTVAWVELGERNEVQREFSWDEIGYLSRNPRSDLWTTGYGRSELEYLIEIITGLACGIGFNVQFFTNSHIPPGILTLAGEWKDEVIKEFQSDMIENVGGSGKWHKLPILFGESDDAKASFITLREQGRLDMHWEKWISFLVNIICGVYQMAPEEIGFQGFRQQGQAMQEADPASKIVQSYDTGFVPLMLALETFLNEQIIEPIDDRFQLRWVNLRKLDREKELALGTQRLNAGTASLNQVRAELNDPEWRDPLDPVFWKRCEKAVVKRWPLVRHDREERERLTAVVYEQTGGKYCTWPDAPGMPVIVSQLYMREKGSYFEDLGGGGAGVGELGGEETQAGPWGSVQPDMPSAQGVEAPSPPGTPQEAEQPQGQAAGAAPDVRRQLLEQFQPPQPMAKAVEEPMEGDGEGRGIIARIGRRLSSAGAWLRNKARWRKT